jgi:hypothetical protein
MVVAVAATVILGVMIYISKSRKSDLEEEIIQARGVGA